MEKNLDITIQIKSDNWFNITVHEPESGLTVSGLFPISVDEHPEFDMAIGNEIYSWIQLMLDELSV